MLIWSNLAKKLLSEDNADIILEDLVGPHMLSGVDETREKVDSDDYDDSDVLTFILDDITFSVIEDPEDGYRSSMRELVIGEYKCKNTFKPIPVVCKMNDNEDKEVLEVYWEDHLILEVGTDHTDSWYPYFVGHWDPTHVEFKTYE